MMRRIRDKIVYVLFLLITTQGLALPQYMPTMLPFPDLGLLEDSEREIIKEALSLEVYQDHKDPNQYYYVPPFHIRQYTKGAAGMMLHAHNIKQYAAANKEIARRESYDFDKIDELATEIERNKKGVEEAKAKYREALKEGIKEIIELEREMLEAEKANLDKNVRELAEAKEIIKNGGSLLPKGIAKNFNERIVMKLAAAGFEVPYNGKDDPDAVFTNIQQLMLEFSSSYGGFLSINAYAGFTRSQLDSLIAFKTKYAPHIKISLLPIEKLVFFPLTEWQLNPDEPSSGSKFFRQVKGAGDYLGASIVMDTTLSGSLGLAEHMAPFVLPVGIKAIFKQQLLPTDAELTCDFTSGFTVRGRADVRDGLVIFDNDITNTIKANDTSSGACNIKLISGDPGSAEFLALKDLESVYENMRFRRTTLAYEEKQRYYQGVLADINNNRRQDEPTYTRFIRSFNGIGWDTVILEGITRAADFHWHTNIQDVANMSNVRFTKRLSIQGHTTVEKDLPTNLCLVFNSQLNAYDRCTPVEELRAKNMQTAMHDAHGSEACSGIIDPFECGRQRDAAGETARRDNMVPEEDDNIIMSTIR